MLLQILGLKKVIYYIIWTIILFIVFSILFSCVSTKPWHLNLWTKLYFSYFRRWLFVKMRKDLQSNISIINFISGHKQLFWSFNDDSFVLLSSIKLPVQVLCITMFFIQVFWPLFSCVSTRSWCSDLWTKLYCSCLKWKSIDYQSKTRWKKLKMIVTIML